MTQELLPVAKVSQPAAVTVADLSYEQKLQAAAKILGYRSMPPSIEKFIDDPYYLGNSGIGGKAMYPFWKDELKKIFPTPIHTAFPFIVLTGAIGIGKSTFSKVVALYNECRLMHMNNLNFFGIAVTKPINFIFFHTSVQKAHDDFIGSCDLIAGQSPFFLKMWGANSENKIPMEKKADGPRSNNAIGGDVIFYNLSEINFVRYDKAEEKIDTAFKRWNSRFMKAYGYIGNIILDTSAQGDASVVENFIKHNKYKIHIVRGSTWAAKAHLKMHFRQVDPKTGLTHFEVYSGDSIHGPFIITPAKELTEKMDRDRVIKVPNELRSSFEFNIETSLQDEAGISTTSTGKFLPDNAKFLESMSIKQLHKDVMIVDFYDKTDRILDKIRDQIEEFVPKDRILFIRFDIGVVKDLCGVSITYFEKFIPYSTSTGSKLQIPTFKTPVAFGLSRKSDQETPISHLMDFILDLRETHEIGLVTADQYASRQLLQDLEREGIPSAYLSVDRTDAAYIYWKQLTNSGCWQGPQNDHLINEICNLLHVGGKVDHPHDSSKDVADAMVGSVYSAYQNLELAQMLSSKYRTDHQLSIINNMLGMNQNSEIQGQLQNYKW